MSSLTKQKIDVRAAEFGDGDPMPNALSAYFDDISPEISWSGVPEGSRSLALMCEDPDAPREPSFVHWLVANLPPELNSLPAGMPDEFAPRVLQGGIQGTNDKGRIGYYGPRPPAGTGVHHYHFHVLALDRMLDLPGGFDRDQFQEAITDHVIGQGSVVGTFEAP